MTELGDLANPHIGGSGRQGFSKAKLSRPPRRDTTPSDRNATPAWSGATEHYREKEAHERFLYNIYGNQETKPQRTYKAQIIDDDPAA
jgi:hypothetical protein